MHYFRSFKFQIVEVISTLSQLPGKLYGVKFFNKAGRGWQLSDTYLTIAEQDIIGKCYVEKTIQLSKTRSLTKFLRLED